MSEMTMSASAALAEQLRWLPVDGERPTGVPRALADVLSPIRRYRRRPPSHASLDRLEYELLAALACSGWSLRHALVEAVNHDRYLAPRSGSLKLACAHLAHAGLWAAADVRVAGRRPVLVRLTPLGRASLAQVGITAIESEWEEIEARHAGGSAGQSAHTAAICLFTYQARRRGWRTEVCPVLGGGRSAPDVRAARDLAAYVEVQRWGGEMWRHADKWRNQFALQGFAAICAETPTLAARLAREAQLAGVPTGRITDLATLAAGGAPDLWTHYWVGVAGSLQAWQAQEPGA